MSVVGLPVCLVLIVTRTAAVGAQASGWSRTGSLVIAGDVLRPITLKSSELHSLPLIASLALKCRGCRGALPVFTR
jgi:hypothetical protein